MAKTSGRFKVHRGPRPIATFHQLPDAALFASALVQEGERVVSLYRHGSSGAGTRAALWSCKNDPERDKDEIVARARRRLRFVLRHVVGATEEEIQKGEFSR